MIKQLSSPRFIFVCCAILISAGSRLLPHPMNFSPVLAVGLFAGATLTSFGLALIIPMAAMLLSDLFLGFHDTMWATYTATALSSVLGYAIRNKKNIFTVTGVALASAVLFFLISNFAVWTAAADGAYYSNDFAGLMTCYTMAIPFFGATILSNLIYTGILFGTFELAAQYQPALKRIR